jgi:hypothetical protein
VAIFAFFVGTKSGQKGTFRHHFSDVATAEKMIVTTRQHRICRVVIESSLCSFWEEFNADFDALGQLDKAVPLFITAELDELRCLLGLYGVEIEKRLLFDRATIEHAGARQQAWSDVSMRARDSNRRKLAERAVARYGLILHELTMGSATGTVKG